MSVAREDHIDFTAMEQKESAKSVHLHWSIVVHCPGNIMWATAGSRILDLRT